MSAIQANALLLLASAIWGFAFVAQRLGMEHVGPFTFNAIRFALGGISLVPLIRATRARRQHHAPAPRLLLGGLLAGLLLFGGASSQQVGLVTTTAGKAGFITGLYVVLVPLAGLLWGQRVGAITWAGAVLAAVGLYFLSVTEQLTLAPGDLWVLLSAFFWTAHIHTIKRLTEHIDPLPLAAVQFGVCSLLSWGVALASEPITRAGLGGALAPILYGGLMSVGIAYTLQVVAQQHAPPTPAAIIMSLESAFAALGGWMVLGERLDARSAVGAALMMAGMLLAQIRAAAREANPESRIETTGQPTPVEEPVA
jgi:drug/metabolite transporter (DMT)-like permease